LRRYDRGCGIKEYTVDSHLARDAFAKFWTQREDRLTTSGRPNYTAFSTGKDPLLDLVEDELIRAGLHRSHIHRNERIDLPGSYNPTPKRRDLVVLDDGVPIAVVNFKTVIGPAFGNNFNNRVQEILGDAVDLGRPYETEMLRALKPCLALFFALEDCEKSNTTIRTGHSGFACGPSFPDEISYKDRYRIFFERLIRDGRYDAICYLTST
jgi:restriction endonuclease XhoI-like protein